MAPNADTSNGAGRTSIRGRRGRRWDSGKPSLQFLSRQHPFGGLLPRNQGDPILLPQSEIAPWLAEIEPGPPAPGDPDLVMVERPGFYPVKILRPASFTEAVIRLLCRDMVRNNDLALLWLFMIDRIKEDETTFSRHLRPEFQAAWNGLMGGGGYRNHLVEAAQLREKLIAENRLPADLPCISIDEEFKNMPSQDVRRLRGEVQFDKAKPIFERFAAELLQMPKISPDTDIEPMRMLHRFFRDC
ncbi:hypothetical protein ASPSYDRAFT_39018 [Aspergillus sydowii CBS 593.65]|uniref:Uncharacterized protein n=1 Tax=Aspergillus sydowii CBS 593.65 TaxID=1036612 RepID=A0A1L9TY11_9EURO|nr:uncharacterized protein ASPSYDRAFT_39018 [Aspergillus sydowii CBS 593.65]OJJ64324.1 hypothetical protein ASPSYDRAFT_39018 [Aspergillus sydowii CBS 593.65]